MRQLIPAYEFRRRARVRMKPVLPLLLVVALIAVLPSLISSMVMLMTDSNPTTLTTDYYNRLLQVMEDESLTGSLLESAIDAAQDEYIEKALAFFGEKGLLLAGLLVLTAIIAPALNLGLINAYLHTLRQQDFTPAIALSRMSSILKLLGLEILTGLKIAVWMLPGMAVSIGGVFVMVLVQETVGELLIIGGIIAACVMCVRAAFSYSLSTYVLADEPSTGIRECIRRSKAAMNGRRMELFGLEISFIGWQLLLSMAQTLLLSLFGQVIGQTLGMFASLFLTVYTGCALTAFYQAYICGREDYVDADPEEQSAQP